LSSKSLKEKTLKGFFWNMLEKSSIQVSQLVLGILLARLLSPSDFGLIGMLVIFILIAELFAESGFSKALIQKQDRSEVDFSTVFYFNIGVSGLIYLGLFFSAPLIAQFYKTPELILLTRVMGLSVLINALVLVQKTKLVIDFDFKTLAKINFTSIFISGIISVLLAFSGWGVWALVAQSLIKAFIAAILFWYFGKWKPLRVFSKKSFKQLFSFGSKLLGAGLLAVISQNIYLIIIGRNFSASSLGFYTNAKKLSDTPSNFISSVIHTVSFPVLSSLQDNQDKMISVYRKLMKMTGFLALPVLVLLTVLAEPLIQIFLTDKWLPAVPLFQILCISKTLFIISGLNMNILNAIGRSDLYLKLDIIKMPIIILSIIITIPFGVKALVIGQSIVVLISFFINTYYPGKLLGYGFKKQMVDLFPAICLTLIMFLITYGTIYFLPTNILKLIVGIVIGVLSYGTIAYLMKFQEFQEIKERLFNK
jgi:O-antigen/teichoic acid export membrane protein